MVEFGNLSQRSKSFMVVLGLVVSSLPNPSRAASGDVSFTRDVQPILADRCFACHGPDSKTRKADLRLDTAEGVFGSANPVVVPGDSGKSSLVARILSTDDAEVMPPSSTKKPLSAAQKDILKRWVEQGAKYQKHWAFEPISAAPAPTSAETPHPVDAFLNQRLKQSGLAIQPGADRETLIRRVAFTLTGLPPTVKEIDDYFKDASPDAYQHMVDRYLDSPRYGEEMARHWLDVARYADTHGLHLDNERQMWAYRDWVIKAFNENLPFDQFTVWQVAGDLLPNSTRDQKIATGFNRCNVTSGEGGSINDELLYRYAVERTTAVSQAWLGLTAGCAVCHDHKYDPLSTKEFYSLYAFFNSAADPAMDGNTSVTAPFMKLPQPRQMMAASSASKVEGDARSWIDTTVADLEYVDPADAKTPVALKAVRDELLDDAIPIGTTVKSSSRNPLDWRTDPPFKSAAGRRVLREAFASTAYDEFEYKLRPYIVPKDAVFEFSIRVETADVPASVSFGILRGKAVTWNRVDGRLERESNKESIIIPGQWNRLTVPAADLGLNAGDRLNGIRLSQFGGIAYWDQVTMAGQSEPALDTLESLNAWRRTIGTTVPPELPDDLRDIIKGGRDKELTADEATKLRRYYLAMIARPVNDEVAAARTAWETARAARIIAEETAPGTFVYNDIDKPRDSFVMLRGQYDKKGDPVEPAVPAVLPAIPRPSPDKRLNRLDLAQWLVTDQNPLPARVTVNRLWQQVFGTGLVKTSFDFGTQGDPPSHPELLDWLAHEYRASGWNTKKLIKLLVTSDAFRRQSRLTPETKLADPHNLLYAHGPRIRLDAEQVRDNALYVSGLMDLMMGGRGVRPYQPPNIWEPVGYTDSNTRFYMQDHGESLYRRSIYVFLKRTAPPPFMSNFDAPNREQVCTVRERSNTPLQALQLMNDVQHFEAARALAERTLTEGGDTTNDRMTFLFRSILSRSPTSDELPLLTAALQRQTELFAASPDAAKSAIHVGESKPRGVAPDVETASWTMLANLVLNMDETLNRN